jgi:hypothetical protein
LEIAGVWAGWGHTAAQGFLGPQVTGAVKLRNTRIALRGVGGPIELAAADLRLLPDEVRVEKLTAKVANTLWAGSLEMPRGCGTPSACQVRFILNANQTSFSEVSAWVSPRAADRPWYRVLGTSGPPPSFLASVRASGRLNLARLLVHNLSATRVAANLSLDAGKLKISDLSADFLGGKYQGDWHSDFGVKPPVTSGSGRLTGISLSDLSEVMNDPLMAGTATGSYQLTASGSSAADFWQSAEGALRFEISDGQMSHVSWKEDEALKITRLSGQARLHDAKIEVKEATLDSASGRFQLSGTASLKRDLDLRLVRFRLGTAQGYTITGTLAEPRVASLPGTEQARLKPEAAK